MKGYFLNIFLLVLITGCSNPLIDQADIETADRLPAALDNAQLLRFIFSEGQSVDTLNFQLRNEEEFRSYEPGSLMHHRVLEWETTTGNVLVYWLYSSLPAKYGGEGYHNSPRNVAEISFNNQFSLFSNDDILKATDSIPEVIYSLEIDGAGEKSELEFDRLGIKELRFITKGITLKRLE